jgi:hypothetical protein
MKFTPNIQKIIETLLWIINKKPDIALYHVMKIMFAADCYHLSKFGRPVTGDYYVAVRHGVMPSITKDIIDKDPWVLSDYGVDCSIVDRRGNSLVAHRDFDRGKFSKSDIEALEYGFAEYANIPTFGEVREKNHRHPAWINAARKQGYDTSKETEFAGLHQIVDFEDMIDNDEVLEDMKELGPMTEQMLV